MYEKKEERIVCCERYREKGSWQVGEDQVGMYEIPSFFIINNSFFFFS